MLAIKVIQKEEPVNEVLVRIARAKYGNYGLDASDIMIDREGRAVLRKSADKASWDFCLAEAAGGEFRAV